MAHPDKNKRPSSMRGNAQQRRSARYFKKNKAGDAGGQEARPNVNDNEMIFTSYRRPERVKAAGGRYMYGHGGNPKMKKNTGGRAMYNKGGQPHYSNGEMPSAKPN